MRWQFGEVTELEDRGDQPPTSSESVVCGLVNAEVGPNFLEFVNTGQPPTVNVTELLTSMAADSELWNSGAKIPWNRRAEEIADGQISTGICPRVVLDVLAFLRDERGKSNVGKVVAAFMFLGRTPAALVLKWTRNINLSRTCDEGCVLGGDVAKAAAFLRRQLRIPETQLA